VRLHRTAALPHAAEAGPLTPVLAWIDDAAGVLGRVRARLTRAPDPTWWVYSGDLARTPAGSWYSPSVVGAAGASLDPGEALRRMLGETVERYSAATATPDDVRRMTLRESGLAGRLPTCAPGEPCPPSLRRSDGDVPLSHVAVRRLADGETAWAPSPLVYMGLAGHPDETLVTLPTSTGCAFATELHDALWAGLCEVVERDAFMLAWWTERALPMLRSDDPALPSAVASRIARMRYAGRRTRLLAMTTEIGIPAVLCVVSGSRRPHLVVGAGCHADPARACAKALDEGLMALISASAMVRPVPSRKDFDWVRSLEDHVVLYADWPDSPAERLLLHDDRATIGWDDFAATGARAAPADLSALAAVASDLARSGLDVLWAELTAPEARGIGHVVRVIVPELVPLSVDHGIRWLGTPRLRAAARATSDGPRFNPYPHPFA
jgi:ribosomal protein S12 methylthiotransferase accessory factor